MKEIILVVHMLVAVGLIGLVLLQQGKGADMGAAFGSGASQSLFGSRGSATFMSRLTAGFATVFFVTSLALTMIHTRKADIDSITQQVVPAPTQPVDAPLPVVPPVPSSGAPEVPK